MQQEVYSGKKCWPFFSVSIRVANIPEARETQELRWGNKTGENFRVYCEKLEPSKVVHSMIPGPGRSIHHRTGWDKEKDNNKNNTKDNNK